MKTLYLLSNRNSKNTDSFSSIMHCYVETGYGINNSIGLDTGSDCIKLLVGFDRGIKSYWRADKPRLDTLHVGYVK